MSAPETFDLKIEFPARVTARIHGEDEIEIISVILNPELHDFCVILPTRCGRSAGATGETRLSSSHCPSKNGRAPTSQPCNQNERS